MHMSTHCIITDKPYNTDMSKNIDGRIEIRAPLSEKIAFTKHVSKLRPRKSLSQFAREAMLEKIQKHKAVAGMKKIIENSNAMELAAKKNV